MRPQVEIDDHKVASWAVQYIAGRDPGDTQPFFLALGLRATHSPWYFPVEYFDRIAGGDTNNVQLPPKMNNDLSDVGPVGRQWAAEAIWQPLVGNAAAVRWGVHSYLAAGAFADDQVGRVLDALDTAGYADNTIVLVVSDNGYHLSEKLSWQKFMLWEEDARVPLIIRLPAGMFAATPNQVDEPVSISAIYPTLLELAGIAAPAYPQDDPLYRIDYRSLVPLLDAATDADWAGPAVTYGRGEDASLRLRSMRFTIYRDSFAELYDHLADPEEWFNVAGSIQFEPLVALLRNDAQRYLTGQFAPFGYAETCGPPALDPAMTAGVFAWRDCTVTEHDAWRIRVIAGAGGPATLIGGDVTVPPGLAVAGPVDLEAGDTIDGNLRFQFSVVGTDVDGADIALPVNTDICLSLDPLPAGSKLRIGSTKFAMTTPLNLRTLAACDVPPGSGQIGDYVWIDTDRDGAQDSAESGYAGAQIRLVDCQNNSEIAATSTNSAGQFMLQNVPVGSFRLHFITPPGYALTRARAPVGTSVDSNPNQATGLTDCLPMSEGQSRLGIDAGLVSTGIIPVPVLALDDPVADEDSGVLVFSVSLSGGTSASDVTFTASTADGTALAADNDYTPLVAVIGTIPAGATNTTVAVPLTVDEIVEPDETLILGLASVSGNVTVADASGTGSIHNDDAGESSEVPIETWSAPTGGVTTIGNRINYSGTPTGWNLNSVYSVPLASLGFVDDFEVRWKLESDPAGSIWIVGLGINETNGDWRDIDYGLRNVNGQLSITESGNWRTNSANLASGDVISIYVSNGTIEYRLNGTTVYASAYTGMPGFYVDTAFRSGAIALSVTVEGDRVDVDPPGETPIDGWVAVGGGVSANGSALHFSGIPADWNQNTAISPRMSTFGATDDYTVSWTIEASPAATTWVAGLGAAETPGEIWRDVDFGMRSSQGTLNIRVNGNWIVNAGPLATGDILSMVVSGTTIEYRRNDVPITTSAISGTEDFYIDTAFKNGAITLGRFTLSQ